MPIARLYNCEYHYAVISGVQVERTRIHEIYRNQKDYLVICIAGIDRREMDS